MVTSDRVAPEEDKVDVSVSQEVQEDSGFLKQQTEEEKLMRTMLEADESSIENGHLLADAVTQGIGSFVPDLIFENLVKDFKIAKQLYGEVIIRELTGYNPNYVQKNLKIPEFKKELKKRISDNIEGLKEKKLLDKEGSLTDNGLLLSSLVLYIEEIDNLIPKGYGKKEKKEKTHYGEKNDITDYKKSRYRDIAIKASLKRAIRRGHEKLLKKDLKIIERQGRGRISVIYGLDSSGSMKGPKLKTAKKAGIALSFKAIEEKNKVGLLVFGDKVRYSLEPTMDFLSILKTMSNITAANQTDFKSTILKAMELFPKHETKHLILLTDALPTKGHKPEEETLEAVSPARDLGITISVVGIKLDKPGEKLAEKIAEVGQGRLYKVSHLEELDKIILEDYSQLKTR